jgi:hypothetical protein
VIRILCGQDGDDLFLLAMVISPLQGFYQFEEIVVIGALPHLDASCPFGATGNKFPEGESYTTGDANGHAT